MNGFGHEPRRIKANGLDFAYFELGQGPLALLLHGFPDTAHTWTAFAPALAKAGFRVVAPFTRGYAPTGPAPSSATTLRELAEDALALIEALGYSTAVVVGHDWGAATTYLASAMAPEKITSAIAIGIPHLAVIKPSFRLIWGGRHFATLRMPGAEARLRQNDFAGVDMLYRRWSPTWKFVPEETRAVKDCFTDPVALSSAIGYYRGFRPGHQEPAFRGRCSVPTLAVAGLDDPILTVSMYEEAQRKFDGAYRVVALPGGHFVHRESPERFCEEAISFLTSAQGGSPS